MVGAGDGNFHDNEYPRQKFIGPMLIMLGEERALVSLSMLRSLKVKQ